ncbi:MAG TPA: hypothetical protein VJV78_42990 [Polyangiales bacterium]|nr:hypothetical protein [Polyangiales bacterium]
MRDSRASMRVLSLVCSIALGQIALSRAHAAEPLELEWSAPAGCPDREYVRGEVSERLGERAAQGSPLSASGQIEATAAGFELQLRAQGGERRLEAASCEELAESAAVILALLIDPQAASPPPAASEPGLRVWGAVRAELVGDLGLLPGPSLGPGLALAIGIENSSLELSGTYLPTQDLESPTDGEDVGDLRAFAGRVSFCQLLLPSVGLSPCASLEYARLTGAGSGSLDQAKPVDASIWSLLLAARWSPSLGGPWLFVLELAAGLPFSFAAFTLQPSDLAAHETGKVLGRLRAGLELRF